MLGIFNTDPELQARFEEWTTCKQYINQDLVKNLTSYDPTAKEHIIKVDAKALARILQGKIYAGCCAVNIAKVLIFVYLNIKLHRMTWLVISIENTRNIAPCVRSVTVSCSRGTIFSTSATLPATNLQTSCVM